MAHVFKIGDIAVALDTNLKVRQQRFKGQKYLVKAISFCPNTGIQLINLGYIDPKYKIFACDCGEKHPTKELYWTSVTGRFCSEEEWDALCAKNETEALDNIVDQLGDEVKKS